MKTYIYTLLIILLSLHTNPSKSQNKWSLEDCINYALENNIQIKQQQLNVDYSNNILTQSKADILPNLNGSYNHNYNWGRSSDPYTNEFTENNYNSSNLGVSSTLVLFNGFQKINTVKQNQFNLLASIEDVEKMKNDISMNIAASYLQILFNIELLEIAKKQLETTQFQVERTGKLVDAGSSPEGNLLEIEAQQATDELQVVNAQNQLDISYLTLIQLLDLDSINNFSILSPELPELNTNTATLSLLEIYDVAEKNMPEIKSAEYKLLSSEKGLVVAKGARSPRLSMTLSWGTGYSSAYENYFAQDSSMTIAESGFAQIGTENYSVYSYYPEITYGSETVPYGDQFRNNSNTSLGFNLTIPIFNGLQVSKGISNAKINVLTNEYNLQLTKNQLHKEIQQKYTDVSAALKNYYATKKALESINKSFEYTQNRFEVGLINFVDYNIAKNNLVRTESDLLQAKYDYIFKLKTLDFYRGIPLKL